MLPKFPSLLPLTSLLLTLSPLILAQEDKDCTSYLFPNASGTTNTSSVSLGLDNSPTFSHNPPWLWTTTVTSFDTTIQSFYIHTTTSQNNNYTSSIVDVSHDPSARLPFPACAFIYVGVPASTSAKGTHDDGTCSSIISISCTQAINQAYLLAANSIGDNVTDSQTACSDISVPLPSECSAIAATDVINAPLSGISPNCSTSSALVPELAATHPWGGLHDPTNSTAFKLATAQIVPIVTLIRGTSPLGIPWTHTELNCVRPSSISAGSSGGASASTKGAAGSGFRENIRPGFTVGVTILVWVLTAL